MTSDEFASCINIAIMIAGISWGLYRLNKKKKERTGEGYAAFSEDGVRKLGYVGLIAFALFMIMLFLKDN